MFDYDNDCRNLNLDKLVTGDFCKTLIITGDTNVSASRQDIFPLYVNVLIPEGIYVPTNVKPIQGKDEEIEIIKVSDSYYVADDCLYTVSIDHSGNLKHCTTALNIMGYDKNYITVAHPSSKAINKYSIHCVGKILGSAIFQKLFNFNIREVLPTHNSKAYILNEETLQKIINYDADISLIDIFIYIVLACTYFVCKHIYFGDNVEVDSIESYYETLLRWYSSNPNHSINVFENGSRDYTDIAQYILLYLEFLSHDAIPGKKEAPNGSVSFSFDKEYRTPLRCIYFKCLDVNIFYALGKPAQEMQSTYQNDMEAVATELAECIHYDNRFLPKHRNQAASDIEAEQLEEFYIKPTLALTQSYKDHISNLLKDTQALATELSVAGKLKVVEQCYSYLENVTPDDYKIAAIDYLRCTDVTYLKTLQQYLGNITQSNSWRVPVQIAKDPNNISNNSPMLAEPLKYSTTIRDDLYHYSYTPLGLEARSVKMVDGTDNIFNFLPLYKYSYTSLYNMMYYKQFKLITSNLDSYQVLGTEFTNQLLMAIVELSLYISPDATHNSYAKMGKQFKLGYQKFMQSYQMAMQDDDPTIKQAAISLKSKLDLYMSGKYSSYFNEQSYDKESQLLSAPFSIDTFVNVDYTEILIQVDTMFLFLLTQICPTFNTDSYYYSVGAYYSSCYEFAPDLIALMDQLTTLFIANYQDSYDNVYEGIQAQLHQCNYKDPERTLSAEKYLVSSIWSEEHPTLQQPNVLNLKDNPMFLEALKGSMFDITGIDIVRVPSCEILYTEAPNQPSDCIGHHRWRTSGVKLRMKIPTAYYRSILDSYVGGNASFQYKHCLCPTTFGFYQANFKGMTEIGNAVWNEML